MNISLLHHLGVPCVASIRELDKSKSEEKDIYYLNPLAILRYEPEGIVITPPMLYSSFLYGDKELTNLLKKRSFSVYGLPNYLVALLVDNNVISKDRYGDHVFREMSVDIKGLPTQVLLDVTSDCNCDCVTCYHKHDLNRYTPLLEEIKERIDRLRFLGIGLFEVTGGEPFLRSDIIEILKYIADGNSHFYLVSNGEYLMDANSELISILKKSLGVAISLDGVGEIHDEVRQRTGLYDKLIKGLDLMFSENIQVFLISTLNERNVSCVEEMIKLAEKHNTTLHLRSTISTGAAKDNQVGNVDLREALSRFFKHKNVRNGLLSTKKVIPSSLTYGCGIRKRISVSSEGYLFPCVMDRERKNVSIMDVGRRELVEILINETRELLSLNKFCNDCSYNQDSLMCGGFCRFSNSYTKNKKEKI